MVLDKDVIEFVNHADYGAREILKKCCDWIQSNIVKQIETRKEDIRGKRPEALSSRAEPRIIWITALPRPQNSANGHVFSLITKFNDILDDLVYNNKYTHFLELTSVNEYIHFDRRGSLTVKGQEQFWHEVDFHLKNFDRAEDNLKSPKEIREEAYRRQRFLANQQRKQHDRRSHDNKY